MITESAKHSLDFLFTKAIKGNLVMESPDFIEVESLRSGQLVAPEACDLVVLTIANYAFRLLLLFHVGRDQATASYYTQASAEADLLSVFPEVCNLCCGALNRDLGQHFLHLGMSTPALLDSKCLSFLDELKPDYSTQFRIVINGCVVLRATLCMKTSALVDFETDRHVPEEATGLIELF